MSSFSHYARKVVNPDLPLDRRHYALGVCVRKFGMMTYRGSIVDGDFAVYRQTLRECLSRRFGLDDVSPDPRHLVAVVSVLPIEVNRLREVDRVLYRRRISQKVRGIRTASRAEREAAPSIWERAILRSRESVHR